MQKWTSNSELYKGDQEDHQKVAGKENWKNLQLPSRNNLSDQDSTEHPSPSESEERRPCCCRPSAKISYESDDEDLFSPGIYTPEGQKTEETAEIGAEEEDADKNLMDTEFTRDYYRLVKFESNRSLANSEKYDHCPAETEQTPVVAAGPLLPPPDRQVALQTVLDFITEQQR